MNKEGHSDYFWFCKELQKLSMIYSKENSQREKAPKMWVAWYMLLLFLEPRWVVSSSATSEAMCSTKLLEILQLTSFQAPVSKEIIMNWDSQLHKGWIPEHPHTTHLLLGVVGIPYNTFLEVDETFCFRVFFPLWRVYNSKVC